MATLTFNGGTSDWFDPNSWTPSGTPEVGDTLIVGSGDAEITAQDVASLGSLDHETLRLGSAAASAPATLSATGALFGSAFFLDIGGTNDQAVIDLAGSSVFAGTLDAAGTSGTADLQIGAAGAAQSLTLLGGITVSAGADLIIAGGTLADDGTLAVASGSTLDITAGTTLTGHGTILVEGGTLELGGPVSSGVTIEFVGGAAQPGTILIGAAASFDGTITGLVKADFLDLVGVIGNLPEYNASTGKLTILQGITRTGEVAAFSLFGNFGADGLYVGPNGTAGSRISQVVPRSWTGESGDWYTTTLWSSPAKFVNSFPAFGDSATISAGTVSLTAADFAEYGSLDNVDIDIGGNATGGTVVMAVTGDGLGPDLAIATDGTAVTFVLDAAGTVSSAAQIGADGAQGMMTLAVTPGGDFINQAAGQLEVDSESGLVLAGGEVTNLGLISDDQSTLTVAAGTTVDGSGAIDVQDGGTLVVAGTIGAGQVIAVSDGSEVVLAPGGAITATLDGFLQGDTIALPGEVATYASFDTANEVLTLRDGGATGAVVATLQLGQEYGTADFTVASDGAGGSVVTDDAPAPNVISQVLPVELSLAPGATITLAAILQEAFGTAALPYASYDISSSSLSDLYNDRFSFWNPNDPAMTGWQVNGTAVTPDTATQVATANAGDVVLVAGNDIRGDATITVPVAFSNGAPTEYVSYLVRITDPTAVTPVTSRGAPTAADEVATAEAYGTAYADVANTNDCYNIAGEIAGAAGAPIIDYGSTDPTDNESSGDWRQVYIGSDSYSPAVSNWATLLEPGDIVRVAWDTSGQHSTTVLSAPTLVGSVWHFDVVDNDDNAPGYEAIGIHSAAYEQSAEPDSISIFRLDPAGEYLITGGTVAHAVVQGSTNDNLIIPQAAGDTIYAGPGANIIADNAQILDGTTIADFHAGDTIDNTTMGATDRHVSYDALSGVLTLSSTAGFITLDLPVGLTGSFELSSDGGTISGGIADGGLVPPGVSPRALDGGDLGTLYTALGTLTGADVTYVACYGRGTHIATPGGTVPVEQLIAGDAVRTESGRHRPVRWIGHRRVDCRRHPRPQDVWPVRIAAGAFARNVPARDLLLSPDHAVFARGVLIPARILVNGATIIQEKVDAVEYWHVELDSHDVLLAENLPAESYLDAGNRGAFANGGTTAQLHPDFAPGGEAQLFWEAAGCAPLRIAGVAVRSVRASLARRARRRRHAIAVPKRAAPDTAGVSDLAALLQPDWYRATNPDVAADWMDPHTHYVSHGRAEGRLPCPEADLVRGLGLVDPAMLAFGLGDVVAAELDIATHYMSTGWRERRWINPYFDAAWYVARAAVPAGMIPLLHYLRVGEPAEQAPGPHFAPAWYRAQQGLGPTHSPLAHYLAHRRTGRVSPNPGFDVAAYVRRHGADLRPDRDPYAHYLAIGWRADAAPRRAAGG